MRVFSEAKQKENEGIQSKNPQLQKKEVGQPKIPQLKVRSDIRFLLSTRLRLFWVPQGMRSVS